MPDHPLGPDPWPSDDPTAKLRFATELDNPGRRWNDNPTSPPWTRLQIILVAILVLLAGLGLGMLATTVTAPPKAHAAAAAADYGPRAFPAAKATTAGIRAADASGFITGTPLHEFARATYQEAIGPITLCGYAADSAYVDGNSVLTYTFVRWAQWCGVGPFAMNQNVHAELWYLWFDGIWRKAAGCSTIGAVGGYGGSYTWQGQCAIWGHVPIVTHYNVQLWTYQGSPVLTEWDHWTMVGYS